MSTDTNPDDSSYDGYLIQHPVASLSKDQFPLGFCIWINEKPMVIVRVEDEETGGLRVYLKEVGVDQAATMQTLTTLVIKTVV